MTVTVFHLEMRSPGDLIPSPNPTGTAVVQKMGRPFPPLNRFFYEEVGRDWQWTDKLVWDDTQWREYADRENFLTFIGYEDGTPFGYFELERVDASVELKIFGLLADFIGLGYGGFLLSEAVRHAWAMGPERVWVHTCTLDHPNAKSNYEKRGFSEFKREEK